MDASSRTTSTHRIPTHLCVATFLLACSACGGNGQNGFIPDPGVTQEPLTTTPTQSTQAARAIRSAQVTTWIANNHRAQGHHIVRTDRLDSGTIVDWVDATTASGSSAIAPPPLVSQGHPLASPATVELLSGPAGALPFIRPAFLSYVNGDIAATDVDDYVQHLPHGNPNAVANRLYATASLQQTHYGLAGFVNNAWTGNTVTLPPSTDFSIYELAAYCRNSSNNVTDLVGIVEGVDPAVYGNSTVWGAEYWVNGAGQWITGGGNQNAWHQYSRTGAPGAVVTSASTVGGTQSELGMAVILYSDPNQATPGWWVNVGTAGWIGYFDVNAFSALRSSACIAQYYGEVFDPDQAGTRWTPATMGSGNFPNGSTFANNYGSVGYIRQPGYFSAANGSTEALLSAFSIGSGVDTRCYNEQWTTDGNGFASYKPTMFFGGPGGSSFFCN